MNHHSTIITKFAQIFKRFQKMILTTTQQIEGHTIREYKAPIEREKSDACIDYERLGFTQFGKIPQGFRMKDGHYTTLHSTEVNSNLANYKIE